MMRSSWGSTVLMSLALACGESTQHGAAGNTAGEAGASGSNANAGSAGVAPSTAGRSTAGAGSGGSTESAGMAGEGGGTLAAPTRIIVTADEEADDGAGTGVHVLDVDGTNGVTLYGGLTYGFSLPQAQDRMLINVSNAGATVVLIDLDGKNRVDIPCPGGIQARISPSGKYYAYPEDDGSTYQLYVATVDGAPGKSIASVKGQFSWTWAPDEDVIVWSNSFYDVDSGETSTIPDAVEAFMTADRALSPDGRYLLYVAVPNGVATVRIWDRLEQAATTIHEGVFPPQNGAPIWSDDSRAFVLSTAKVLEYPRGLLASDVTGDTATFLPDATFATEFIAADTFTFETPTGAFEVRHLGEQQGVSLFDDAKGVAVGDGFAAHCNQDSGEVTLVDQDGSNRHVLGEPADCQTGFFRSGRYLGVSSADRTQVMVFHDAVTPPELLQLPATPGGIIGNLRGAGEGFMLAAGAGKSTWTYRKDNEFVTAHPSLALYRGYGGLLLP